MTLFTFAHSNEAKKFIDMLSFKKCPSSDSLFTNNNDLLLITGEGSQETIFRLTQCLSQADGKINNILNFGIVGLIDDNSPLKKGDICEIKTTYSESLSGGFEYSSFTSKPTSSNTADCVSAHNRVVSSEYRSKLSPVAQVVDRELWSIHFVAKKFGIPVASYKLISDFADDRISCFQIQNESLLFSSQLYEYYSLLAFNKESRQTFQSPLFQGLLKKLYLTESQRQKLQRLIQIAETKHQIDSIDGLCHFSPEIKELLGQRAMAEKQRSQKIIDTLSIQLNPMLFKIKTQLDLLLPSPSSNAQFDHCPNLEEQAIFLKAKLTTQDEAQDLVNKLAEISFSQLEKIYSGDALQ